MTRDVMIFLNDAERIKFAGYLEQDAQSNEGLIEQMEKLPALDAVIKKKRVEVMACRVVVQMLRGVETQTIK
ncbi:MAG: hypothetical protein GY807_20950 [Gammaproteobacteria bacterium]|nr:hypothetical protein [Gammaproteobacteria bacterium]